MAASKENRTISQFKSRLAGGGARPNPVSYTHLTLPTN